MPTKEQREALEDALTSTLARAIDFIKFAETKNAALLTFASAWLVALSNLLVGDRALDRGPRTALIIALLLLAVAAIIALRSFLPKLALSTLHRDPDRSKNLLYFGDIAKFEPSAYARRIRERYAADPEQTVSDDYLDDLAVQVAANSRIALRKFKTFDVGVSFVIAALSIMTATAGYMAFGHIWSK
ncbi:DUF5706 domain-containing protein [Bradyrhizobium barranii subsp. barranii]|uniref:DUF5706 domain-containing protein n=1 Tax=Bradyrhizobium barranii subsp. barranii TaxID=2823807 RepID=A0A7Z0QD39_9BRAD|nr:Pycsar system effector family protein [Bradyrhizobium barranii]UGX92936.1 DUF5706 domain-containing protein [Bradyrhizobium barranii subsp. barranii]